MIEKEGRRNSFIISDWHQTLSVADPLLLRFGKLEEKWNSWQANALFLVPFCHWCILFVCSCSTFAGHIFLVCNRFVPKIEELGYGNIECRHMNNGPHKGTYSYSYINFLYFFLYNLPERIQQTSEKCVNYHRKHDECHGRVFMRIENQHVYRPR